MFMIELVDVSSKKECRSEEVKKCQNKIVYGRAVIGVAIKRYLQISTAHLRTPNFDLLTYTHLLMDWYFAECRSWLQFH